MPNTAEGKTYADLGDVQADRRGRIASAQRSEDPALADLQKQLQEVTTQRETLFKGETLRGLLLTSYGFSVFGAKASQVAAVAYASAGLMIVLAVAGFLHAVLTPRTGGPEAPAPPPSPPGRSGTLLAG